METIEVFHRKLPSAKQPGFGTGFVPELRLNLVNRKWKIVIGKNNSCGNRRNNFFVRGSQSQLLPERILKLVHYFRKALPASCHIPYRARMKRGHQHLGGAKRVHFFADNFHHFFLHPIPKWKKCIDPRHQFINKICPCKQTGIYRLLIFGLNPFRP